MSRQRPEQIFSLLEKDARQMTLSFLLGQLLKAGVRQDALHFDSEETSYSHAHLIESFKFKNGQAYIGVNLGWLSSQSHIKGLSHCTKILDSPAFSSLSRFWLKSVIFMMHPELDRGYQDIFDSGIHIHAMDPSAHAQINRQMADLFSEYDFDLEIFDQGACLRTKAIRLGEARLNSENGTLGEFKSEKSEIRMTMHQEELIGHQEIKEFVTKLNLLWIASYGKYWQGFKFKLFQQCTGEVKAMHLPNRLGAASYLNRGKQLLVEIVLG
tara:strand:- start:1609 stop:2415 length:807 start_codon:yes stop_codon:yes gene_type:complete